MEQRSDDEVRREAHDLLDSMGELSGWEMTLEALHTICEVDAKLLNDNGTVH